MLHEIAYDDRDNTIDLILTADGAAVNLAGVTRMQLIPDSGAFFLDSDTSPAAFDWLTYGGDGKLILSLGGFGVPIGTHTCTLTVFDPSNDDGIVWDKLKITVRALYSVPVV